MSVAATTIGEKDIEVEFCGWLGFSCWKDSWILVAAKVGDRAVTAFLVDDVYGLRNMYEV